jgi:hypothetical protein
VRGRSVGSAGAASHSARCLRLCGMSIPDADDGVLAAADAVAELQPGAIRAGPRGRRPARPRRRRDTYADDLRLLAPALEGTVAAAAPRRRPRSRGTRARPSGPGAARRRGRAWPGPADHRPIPELRRDLSHGPYIEHVRSTPVRTALDGVFEKGQHPPPQWRHEPAGLVGVAREPVVHQMPRPRIGKEVAERGHGWPGRGRRGVDPRDGGGAPEGHAGARAPFLIASTTAWVKPVVEADPPRSRVETPARTASVTPRSIASAARRATSSS